LLRQFTKAKKHGKGKGPKAKEVVAGSFSVASSDAGPPSRERTGRGGGRGRGGDRGERRGRGERSERGGRGGERLINMAFKALGKVALPEPLLWIPRVVQTRVLMCCACVVSVLPQVTVVTAPSAPSAATVGAVATRASSTSTTRPPSPPSRRPLTRESRDRWEIGELFTTMNARQARDGRG
jgi:hypothetical protein